MALPLDALVFVYGTLKQGYYNYDVYLKPAVEMGKAEFVAAAKTGDPAFHLVLKKDRWVPCMYRAPTKADGYEGELDGYQVPGEVYRVDRDVVEALDILEGVDEAYYLREDIPVELLEGPDAGKIVTCGAYVMLRRAELLELTRVPEYTLELHVGYKSKVRTPKLRILKCLYGSEAADKVQALVDSGVQFQDAWKQVVG